MDYISATDIYEIRIASLISNVDKDVIIELYQPIIGSTAAMLYLTLLRQGRSEIDDQDAYTHDYLMTLMQVSPGNLLTARHFLEGVGLLRTFVKENGEERSYIYSLYAPKSPKDFFDDVLFKGMYIQCFGEKVTNRIARKYQAKPRISSSYEEKSSKFTDVFNLDYEDSSFKKEITTEIIGRKVGPVKIAFNYDLLFKYIESNSQFSKSSFTDEDLKIIERIATLFNISETSMASIVIDDYRYHETPHLDSSEIFEYVKENIKYPYLVQKRTRSKISSTTELGSDIKKMEELSPFEWLSQKQNNARIPSPDMNIIYSLSENYGLSNGVINVVLDYVLKTNNNMLSKNFCEKIAASLVREKIETAIDAMDYLERLKKPKTTRSTVKEEPAKSTIKSDSKKEQENKVDENNNDSEEEIEELLASIYKHDKGGKK